MIGDKFGGLVIEEQAGKGPRGLSWWCKCIHCARQIKRSTSVLVTEPNSCGCLVRHHPNVIQPSKELKQAHHLTFVSWKAMLARCYYSKQKQKCYEGVSVCDRWFDFRNFLVDMGERPSIEYSIDRKNPTQGYSKENCQWILKTINSGKTRTNRDPEILKRRGQTYRERRAAGVYAPLSEESRRGIAAGAVKRIGRKLTVCTKCKGRSYVGKLCTRCRKEVSRA